MKESKIEKHPSQEEEDLEIKTQEELEEAKEAAGVSIRKEALERAEQLGVETKDYKLAYEARKEKDKVISFDPEKDITNKDWGNMEKKAEELIKKEGHWKKEGIFMLMEMKLIDPNKFDRSNITDETRDLIKNRLEIARKSYRDPEGEELPWIFPFLFMAVKTIDPKIDVSEEDWKNMKSDLSERSTRKDTDKENYRAWKIFARIAAGMKVINPERFSQEAESKEKDWEGMKNTLKHYDEKSDAYSFCFHAALMKIISPEKFQGLEIPVEYLEELKNSLEACREANEKNEFWGSRWFAENAAVLKVLTAEKLQVTDKGIEITMPKTRNKK